MLSPHISFGVNSPRPPPKFFTLLKVQKKGFAEIGPKEFSERRNQGWSPFLLDVRRSDEEQISSIEGTDSRIMHLEIPSRSEELPSQGDIVVYCRSGQRSDAVWIPDCAMVRSTIYWGELMPGRMK